MRTRTGAVYAAMMRRGSVSGARVTYYIVSGVGMRCILKRDLRRKGNISGLGGRLLIVGGDLI